MPAALVAPEPVLKIMAPLVAAPAPVVIVSQGYVDYPMTLANGFAVKALVQTAPVMAPPVGSLPAPVIVTGSAMRAATCTARSIVANVPVFPVAWTKFVVKTAVGVIAELARAPRLATIINAV